MNLIREATHPKFSRCVTSAACKDRVSVKGVRIALFDSLKWFLDRLSWEGLLTKCHFPNGGTVVLLRSLRCSVLIFALCHLVRNPFDPERTWYFTSEQLRTQVTGELQWFGAIMAAIYTAFYARFASQWTYLANLYNQIKKEQCNRPRNDDALAEWQAAFIDDADDLHLSTKRAFAFAISEWGKSDAVKHAFCNGIPTEEMRWDALMRRVDEACARQGIQRRNGLSGTASPSGSLFDYAI